MDVERHRQDQGFGEECLTPRQSASAASCAAAKGDLCEGEVLAEGDSATSASRVVDGSQTAPRIAALDASCASAQGELCDGDLQAGQAPVAAVSGVAKDRALKPHLVGIDVGSTTTKVVVLDGVSGKILFSSYRRHRAHQVQSVLDVLQAVGNAVGAVPLRVAVCGSGGASLASLLQVPYVQEVVAGALAVQVEHPQARCSIELGGQDAKIVFFRTNGQTGRLEVADMRMNGSCAGGTGAFIDEIAALLNSPVEEFEQLAQAGQALYSISGRCGVYAKTDIQPLLNQGALRQDVARSAFHAIAKQTIGGLAQGLDINPPVVFQGGPLTFNPTLVQVFAERLGLRPQEAICPQHPELMMARGAAYALGQRHVRGAEPATWQQLSQRLQESVRHEAAAVHVQGQPFFQDNAQRQDFLDRHQRTAAQRLVPLAGDKGGAGLAIDPVAFRQPVLRCFLGVDSGSTTTKFVLMDEDELPVASFYASNEGKPLAVAKAAFSQLDQEFRAQGVTVQLLGAGTTGYGELLFHSALAADCHTVETVAHATAAMKYVPDVSFILDIGGQDMKALWVDQGVVRDIVVNEACSSGCGSFLESFATSLDIPVQGIAAAAFRSTDPAQLGSRCTVFMNSSIVSEQRNGKTSDDIMAGLCRSIIQNVFTKVVRVANFDSLGTSLVVQGGTFRNDAVLRAFEQYVGRPVTRAPYPGLMGALGAALITKRRLQVAAGDGALTPRAGGLAALAGITYETRNDQPCPLCSNHCMRTLVTFSHGATWVTGNRCERGAVVGNPKDAEVRRKLQAVQAAKDAVPNVFEDRKRLLLADYPVQPLCAPRGITIGIPRVLAFWDTLPFWTTMLRALGFAVKVSPPSTRQLFESGLPSVVSDTVCFPAKLVHGHVRALSQAGVDRIFMPIITTVKPENGSATSESMCAVVKGYPMVVRNSDDPQRRYGVPFDDPLFHWYSDADRQRQVAAYLKEAFGISAQEAQQALAQGDAAQAAFRAQLVEAGQAALDYAQAHGSYAVVLASRPYHNDDLVNHGLPDKFAQLGVAVLPPDALPGVNEVDLTRSRLDIVNNYHARMLASALLAARDPRLEYVQLVSFGCGHDAYLSDEVERLMRETSDKAPLILKVDESSAEGPLRIRVRSFVETVANRRQASTPQPPRQLADPFPVKFTKADRRQKVILVPNTSHAFARLMATVFVKQGVRAEALDLGGQEAIRLGKKYVHNDICFPAQMTIGEALAALESGRYDDADVAIGTGKYVGDCRLTHYSALLRKALDDAGYEHVPIITNDDVDSHNLHPGFRMSTVSALRTAYGLPMIDVLEELLRKMRPYELEPGAADRAFGQALDAVMDGMQRSGVSGAKQGFRQAIDLMRTVRYDRSVLRPTVLIVGEYLLNFHPGANHDVERYLEAHGMEVIEARMTDVIRKTYFYKNAQVREFHVSKPLGEKAWYAVADQLFELAHDAADKIAAAHPLYQPAPRMPQLVQASDPIMHHTFDAGEGVLIPAEILHHAAQGCKAFVILQPFGCLPNHVCGRGISKRLKELYPDVQILPLDYDPDVSFANVENRLQMLIMNATRASGGQGADMAGEGDA